MSRPHYLRAWTTPRAVQAADAVWPSCSGACEQGKRLCVTPQACQINLDEEPWKVRAKAAKTLLIHVALLLALAGLHWWTKR